MISGVNVMSKDLILWTCLVMVILGVGMILYKANSVGLWMVDKKFEVKCECPENYLELDAHDEIVIGCINISLIRKDSSVIGVDFNIIDSVCD